MTRRSAKAAAPAAKVLHEVTVQREDGHRTVVRVNAADEAGARDAVTAMGLRRHEIVDVQAVSPGGA
jgi:hypothetical protein